MWEKAGMIAIKGRSFMKILIASDLHGSAYYTKMLFDYADGGNFDKILLLGDLLYHGPP